MQIRSLVRGVAFFLGFGFVSASAFAADGSICRTYDAEPACCPHPAPSCCPAPVRVGIDDASVLAICGASAPKGEASGVESCKRYYAHGDIVNEVSFSRISGGAAKFEKLKASLAGERAKVSAVTVAGATSAFVLRELEENGDLERSSAWALVGSEVFSIEAERSVCDDSQVVKLLVRAIERARPVRSTQTR